MVKVAQVLQLFSHRFFNLDLFGNPNILLASITYLICSDLTGFWDVNSLESLICNSTCQDRKVSVKNVKRCYVIMSMHIHLSKSSPIILGSYRG